MLFDKVTKQHIIQGIKDFEEKGYPNGFGPSSTYDVVYEGKRYPPPSIMAYAYYHAEGELLDTGFRVGKGSKCFEAIERNGFKIEKKIKSMQSEFIIWLRKNPRHNYFNNDKARLKEALDYYNAFFDKDIYSSQNINELKDFLKNELYEKEMSPFLNYSLKTSNHLPRAILGKKNYLKFLEERTKNYTAHVASNNFTWVKTHLELVQYIKDYKDKQPELIDLLKSVGCDIFNDKDSEENKIDLEVIEPFTFFCYIYKYGDARRLEILQAIATKLKIHYPEDERGIPSANAQKVWMFPWKYLRNSNEIDKLWNLFYQAINNSISEELFQEVLKIKNVGKTKLTEALFYVDPVNYFPINGPIKPYLEAVFGISPNFNSHNDYIKILNQIKEKTDKPFYQLSYEAWLWNENQKEISYWIFQGNPDRFDYESALKDNAIDWWWIKSHKERVKIGDKVILWITGKNAGCYAFGEISGEVMERPYNEKIKNYFLKKSDKKSAESVGLNISHNLIDKPILWDRIKNQDIFKEFKGGSQGTNFSATKEEYIKLLEMSKTKSVQYWLYSPGRNAEYWDEFYKEGIIAIGWDALGDLSQYKTKEDIYEALKTSYGGSGSKKNNLMANFEFAKTISRGDIIIVKRGSSELLGYGVVVSDYFYDTKRLDYKSCRKVDWNIKGNWQSSLGLVHKTLTNITKYESDRPQYDFYYEILLGIMNDEIKEKIAKSKPMHATNQILYGPPGTGKTFYLKEHLFDQYTIKETSISKEKYFEDTVSNLTWWQVTAIALIEMGTSRVNAILENRWVSKKASLSESKNVRATIWGTLQMHTIAESETVAYTQRQDPLIFDKNEDKSWDLIESELKEQAPELYETLDAVNNFKANPNTIIKHYDFVTFHQSFAYEDFIEGIKPILPDVEGNESKDLGYTIEDGVFKSLCAKAAKDPDNRYAIFIDEINRGNVSAIFGELITLIETDKRLRAKNELKIKLPYSKKEFGVPSNLDIYGTMNTADRSVEALDTALRRRFEFKEMMPDYSVIADETVEDLELSVVLETINQRIELLVDRDHTIGHSYFVNVYTTKALANAFNNKIVPLLQEYFYGDYGKIGLVLGKGFIEKTKNDTIEFASFNYENANDFKTPTFVLKQVDSASVVEAVHLLLGKEE